MMLILENVVLFQRLSIWMPYSSCVCLMCESLEFLTQQYLLEHSLMGSTAQSCSSSCRPHPFHQPLCQRFLLFIGSRELVRPAQTNGQRTLRGTLAICVFLPKAFLLKHIVVVIWLLLVLQQLRSYPRRCYSSLNTTIHFFIHHLPSDSCRAKRLEGDLLLKHRRILVSLQKSGTARDPALDMQRQMWLSLYV